jgi:hypothetical protein
MEYKYSSFLVAFIDVLGQRSKLRQLALPKNDTDEERGKILSQLRETAGVILGLRKDFELSFAEYSKEGPLFSELPDKDRQEANKITNFDIMFHSFSDSIAISLPLTDDNDSFTTMIGINACLVALCSIMIASFAKGNPIRGGVDIGPCLTLSETEVYGAALERAYYLESVVADYPRIVIGKEFLDYISYVANHEPKSQLGEMAKTWAIKAGRLIKIDHEGRLFLDFLSEDVFALTADAPVVAPEKIFSMLEDFVEISLKSFYNSDEKNFQRYVRLSNYIQVKKKVYLTARKPSN